VKAPDALGLVFKGAVSRLFTKEDLLHCVCGSFGSALSTVCRRENAITKATILNEIRKKVGSGGFRSTLMRCYSIPRGSLVALAYLSDADMKTIKSFFSGLVGRSIRFFRELSGRTVEREGDGGPPIKLFYTGSQYVRVLDDGRVYYRLGAVSYHVWPILVSSDPLREDCVNVVFFGVRDYIPNVGAIVIRDKEGRKAGFRMGEVDASFAARLTVCRDGVVELLVPGRIRHETLYKFLIGLGRIIEHENPNSVMISLGDLCDYKAVLVDVLSRLSSDYQLILLNASLKEQRFSLNFIIRGSYVDFIPFYFSAREISDVDISRVLQGLRSVSSIYDLVLDRSIDLYKLSIRRVRDGLREEYNNALEELEKLRRETTDPKNMLERLEIISSKLEQLSQGVLTWYLKTGALRVEAAISLNRRRQMSLNDSLNWYRQLVASVDDLLRAAMGSASALGMLPDIISHIKTIGKIAEQVSI